MIEKKYGLQNVYELLNRLKVIYRSKANCEINDTFAEYEKSISCQHDSLKINDYIFPEYSLQENAFCDRITNEFLAKTIDTYESDLKIMEENITNFTSATENLVHKINQISKIKLENIIKTKRIEALKNELFDEMKKYSLSLIEIQNEKIRKKNIFEKFKSKIKLVMKYEDFDIEYEAFVLEYNEYIFERNKEINNIEKKIREDKINEKEKKIKEKEENNVKEQHIKQIENARSEKKESTVKEKANLLNELKKFSKNFKI